MKQPVRRKYFRQTKIFITSIKERDGYKIFILCYISDFYYCSSNNRHN